MNRDADTIVDIINQIERNLDEAKEYQFFGGDALIVNEFDEALYDGNNAVYHLTLTPAYPTGCMPSSCELRWTNTNMNTQSTETYTVRPIYRTDGVFEWVINGGTYYGWTTYITLQYIGKGTVTLTRTS